ncbi:MAG: fatty acid desaturase family protein [Jatrophihabitantaceae bacterium]
MTAVAPDRTEDSWAYNGKRYLMHRFPADVMDELKAINRPDNWHALLAWLQDAAWIAGCIASCYLLSWWLYPLAVLVIGARQRGLSTILHDCAHNVGVANRSLQMLIGTVLTAYPIFQQHYAYKISHVLTHHPKLGSPDADPDLRFFIEQGAYRHGGRRSYVLRIVIVPLLGSQTWGYLKYLVRNRYLILRGTAGPARIDTPDLKRKRALDRAGFWLFWASVVGLAYSGHFLLALLGFWFVPYLTSFQILGWYIELSEHTPLIRDSNIDLYMTRNRKSRGIERFLTAIHNDNYHLEHHLDPRTPFWLLGKAHQVRMRDPEYAAASDQFGGLFHRGPQGQPSAISAIVTSMTQLTEADVAGNTHAS